MSNDLLSIWMYRIPSGILKGHGVIEYQAKLVIMSPVRWSAFPVFDMEQCFDGNMIGISNFFFFCGTNPYCKYAHTGELSPRAEL